jgi:hypothetical protein
MERLSLRSLVYYLGHAVMLLVVLVLLIAYFLFLTYSGGVLG